MATYEFEGKRPLIGKETYVSETADVIGDVIIGDNCYIGPGARIKGDYGSIRIGNETSIQENCVLHARPGEFCRVGNDCNIGHGSILHNCTIGDDTVIGMGAIVSDWAEVGEHCIVGEGSVVTQHQKIPPGKIAVGVPAKVLGDVAGEAKEMREKYRGAYVDLARRYLGSLRRLKESRMKTGERIKKVVTEGYARVAREGTLWPAAAGSCCGSTARARDISTKIGYSEQELSAVPEGANLGLGCGNPVALASLRKGEKVLDLGSGAGLDCFLAAKKVGARGRVIGVDMTPEMIEKARENARKGNYRNVEFRLGEIENLPAADGSVDVVISNCVINLSPDKEKVFRETFRVLGAGGRLMISDMALLKELPESIVNSVEAYVGCLSGAMMKNDYLRAIRKAGFRDIRVIDETTFPIDLMCNDPTAKAVIENLKLPAEALNELLRAVVSIKVQGVKPAKLAEKSSSRVRAKTPLAKASRRARG